jgi:hypothetical protein
MQITDIPIIENDIDRLSVVELCQLNWHRITKRRRA